MAERMGRLPLGIGLREGETGGARSPADRLGGLACPGGRWYTFPRPPGNQQALDPHPARISGRCAPLSAAQALERRCLERVPGMGGGGLRRELVASRGLWVWRGAESEELRS